MISMKIFLLISKIILILSRVVVEMTISGISSSGNWKDQMICMENSWISGFQICQFCDGWGTVSLRFQCNNKEGNLIETKEFGFDSKYRCDYQQLVSCPLPGIIGINVQSQCCSNCKKLDCLGINDMNLVCRNGGGINSGGGCNEGTWSSFTYCPPMTLGCGIKVREDPKGIGDNFGITDFKLYCCATCKIEAGFFESVGKCVMCHENCLTCNGPNYNQCTGCSGTDILQPTGSCSYETNNKVINNKLNSTGISDMTFFDSGFTRSNTVLIFQCHEWFILKAENVGDFIAKELIDISPHYAIRIKARIYKIDEWNGELIELRIDNVVMNVPEFHNFGKNDDNFYFRNLCGGVETDNIISLDKKYDHSANTLKIIFSANHNKKWGINRISIFVYSCHITCLTCYGKEITNCITCKANSILTSSTCQCLEGFYFDNTCSSDDCIPCKACFTGCKTCTGPGIYQCLSCMANYFYIRQKKECSTSCLGTANTDTWTCDNTCAIANQYIDVDGNCKACSVVCKECIEGPTNCISCNSGSFLEDFSCVNICAGTNYGNQLNNKCESSCPELTFIHEVDKKCYGTCPDPYYGNIQTQFCSNTCPSDMFKDTASKTCKFCHFNCLTCNAFKECTSCKYEIMTGSNCLEPTYTKYIDHDFFNNDVFSQSDFVSSGWTSLNSHNPITTDCSTNYHILGGFNTLGSNAKLLKTYNNILPHFRGRITFYFLKIDNWITNNLIFKCDDQIFTASTLSNAQETKLCGEPEISEALRRIDITFPHSKTNMNIEISTDLISPKGFWGIYDLSLSIDVCNNNCLKCSGPNLNDCLSCNKELSVYLVSPPGPSACETTCLTGYSPSKITFECILCDETCAQCNGTKPSECTQCTFPRFLSNGYCISICPDTFYGNKISGKCESNCSATFYPDQTTKICEKCTFPCKNCNESSFHCLNCEKEYFLQDNNCVKTCSETYFFDIVTLTCSKCGANCKFCNSIDVCNECTSNLYLKVPENKLCVACTDKNEFKNETAKICYICTENCEICVDSKRCAKCKAEFYLNSLDQCKQQKILVLNFSYTDSPKIILISGSEKWNNLYDKIKSNCTITISGLNQNEYTYLLKQNQNFSISITLEFKKYVDKSNSLNMQITYKNDERDEYLISNNFLSINLLSYCIPPLVYSKELLTCKKSIFIDPKLEYGRNSSIFLLKFTEGYGNHYTKYKQYTSISISQNNINYKYEINSLSLDVFEIYLYVNESITGHQQLKVNLNPTKEESYQAIQLNSYELSIKLNDIYILDSNLKNMIEQTKQTSEAINNVAGPALAANNIASSGSSFGFKSYAAMDAIRFLRYFSIDYPPNLQVLFESKKNTLDFVPNININEDSTDGELPYQFARYGVSLYNFNNSGNLLLEIATYFFVGLSILLLYKHFLMKIKIPIFFDILMILKIILVWNFALSCFLGIFMLINFNSFLSLRFPTYKTSIGIFNLIFTIMINIGLILFYVYIILKIKSILPYFSNRLKFNQVSLDDRSALTLDLSNRDLSKVNSKEISPMVHNKNDDYLNSDSHSPNLKSQPYFLKKSNNKLEITTKPRNSLFLNAVDNIINKFSKRLSKISSLTGYENFDKEDEYMRFILILKDFHHLTTFQSFFMIYDFTRQSLYSFIIVIFFNMPFAGSILLNILSITFFVMMVVLRPFKEIVEFIQAIINELCILVACACTLGLSSIEKFGIQNEELKINLGWAIIFVNYALILAFLLRVLYIIIRLMVLQIIDLYRYIKNYKKSNQIVPDKEEKLKKIFDPYLEIKKMNKLFDD